MTYVLFILFPGCHWDVQKLRALRASHGITGENHEPLYRSNCAARTATASSGSRKTLLLTAWSHQPICKPCIPLHAIEIPSLASLKKSSRASHRRKPHFSGGGPPFGDLNHVKLPCQSVQGSGVSTTPLRTHGWHGSPVFRPWSLYQTV